MTRVGIALGWIVFLASLPSTVVGQSQTAGGSHKAGDIVLEEATLTTLETGAVNFELGTLYVPENRNDSNSRIIGIGFARFKALQPTGAPPQFHLPGGPGDSFLTGLKQDNKGLAARLKSYELYRRAGDVVIMDQRGHSERGEVLKFERPIPAQPLDKPGSLARSSAAIVEASRAVVAEYSAKGVDLRGYTVLECADDVDDLRKALRYERITLVATSYGSQWSFALMRRHPDIVARALLSGVEPLNYGYDMPSHVFEAIRRMWWEAEQDSRLQPYLPRGGLMAAAQTIVERLTRAPVTVEVKDEKTGHTSKVTLGVEDFQESFLSNSRPVPLLSIYYSHYDNWARGVSAERREPRTEEALIRPSIDTSLGVTPRRLYLLRTDPAKEFLGHWDWDADVSTADIWPSADVGDELRTDIMSRIPVVFAEGDWDTSTPIENTFYTAPFFLNSRVLIAERGGHGVLWPIAQNNPEVMAALLEFLRTGKMDDIPARVTLPKPDFGVPDFPPPQARATGK